MAITVQELKSWLETLDPSGEVALDEGGLVLVEVGTPAHIDLRVEYEG